MTDKTLYSKQLDDVDIAYLAKKYGFDTDFTRGLTDADWSDLLGCGVDELPFYLFDEATFDQFLADGGGMDDDDYYFGDEGADGLFDLNYEIERQLRERPIASAPMPIAKPRPKVSVQHNYTSPSRFAKKVVPKVVKHHFELVH